MKDAGEERMKGLFIPGITTEMFKNGCLESIEALMAEDEIYDIEYSPWIPLKTRPMTEEESTYYRDLSEYGAELFDCPLPDDGQEVLVSWGGNVGIETFVHDDSDGCYFEGVEIDDVEAWMPLPESYKEEREE